MNTQAGVIATGSSFDSTRRMERLRISAWIATGIFGVLMTFSGILYIAGPTAIVENIHRLGYPDYFRTLLGIAKLLGVAALFAPGARVLREWAYAGFTFDMSAAIASHLLSGVQVLHAAPAVLSLALVLTSYFLRRAVSRGAAAKTRSSRKD